MAKQAHFAQLVLRLRLYGFGNARCWLAFYDSFDFRVARRRQPLLTKSPRPTMRGQPWALCERETWCLVRVAVVGVKRSVDCRNVNCVIDVGGQLLSRINRYFLSMDPVVSEQSNWGEIRQDESQRRGGAL